MDEYQKDCECMRSLVVDLVVTCDEIEETWKSAVMNPGDGINHWFTAVVLLSITC